MVTQRCMKRKKNDLTLLHPPPELITSPSRRRLESVSQIPRRNTRSLPNLAALSRRVLSTIIGRWGDLDGCAVAWPGRDGVCLELFRRDDSVDLCEAMARQHRPRMARVIQQTSEDSLEGVFDVGSVEGRGLDADRVSAEVSDPCFQVLAAPLTSSVRSLD